MAPVDHDTGLKIVVFKITDQAVLRFLIQFLLLIKRQVSGYIKPG